MIIGLFYFDPLKSMYAFLENFTLGGNLVDWKFGQFGMPKNLYIFVRGQFTVKIKDCIQSFAADF